MSGPVFGSADAVEGFTRDAGTFGYTKRIVVPKTAGPLHVSFMEIPPGKTAFPYHWHESIAEVYVILEGEGEVRSPEGQRRVSAGDVVYFPAGHEGAHSLANASSSIPLRYVDVDSTASPDVVHHVDSRKVGYSVGNGDKRFFAEESAVDFYAGEDGATRA